MKRNRICINKRCYQNMREAARALGYSYFTIVKHCKENGIIKNGILYLNNLFNNSEKEETVKSKAFGKERCPVYCTTTGKQYPSISAAAKEIGIIPWTMSIKMEKAGKFIDNDGNEYIRTFPMQTRRNYPDIPARMVKGHISSKNTNDSNSNIIIDNNKNEYNNAVEIIRNKAIEQIKAGSYAEASKIINALSLLNK